VLIESSTAVNFVNGEYTLSRYKASTLGEEVLLSDGSSGETSDARKPLHEAHIAIPKR
jgi:hypothetical protein